MYSLGMKPAIASVHRPNPERATAAPAERHVWPIREGWRQCGGGLAAEGWLSPLDAVGADLEEDDRGRGGIEVEVEPAPLLPPVV